MRLEKHILSALSAPAAPSQIGTVYKLQPPRFLDQIIHCDHTHSMDSTDAAPKSPSADFQRETYYINDNKVEADQWKCDASTSGMRDVTQEVWRLARSHAESKIYRLDRGNNSRRRSCSTKVVPIDMDLEGRNERLTLSRSPGQWRDRSTKKSGPIPHP